MAVFTAVTEEDLTHWLEHYSLGEAQALRGIASGIENSNFFLTTTRGEYVLTVFEKLGAHELDYYLHLMRHLAQHNVPVPEPMLRDDGELFAPLHGKPAAIVSRLPGSAELHPTAHHCIEIAHVLARLHLAGRDFPMRQPNLRSLSWWQEVLPGLLPIVPPAQRALLESEIVHQEAFFASEAYAELPEGPCHCDLFRDNALFVPAQGEPHGRLGGIFDFYFAGHDKWLFDVAVTVNDWCADPATGQLDEPRVLAFLRAYQTIRPFTATEVAHWRDMLRAAALRFWVSRLYDFHMPRTAQLLTPHDPGRFEHTLRARIGAPTLPWL